MRVLYFANVREAIGLDGEEVDFAGSLGELGDFLAYRGGGYEVLGDRASLRVARDQVMAGFDDAVGNAREIAFFPPVTGG